jgi:hypothetical protein
MRSFPLDDVFSIGYKTNKTPYGSAENSYDKFWHLQGHERDEQIIFFNLMFQEIVILLEDRMLNRFKRNSQR